MSRVSHRPSWRTCSCNTCSTCGFHKRWRPNVPDGEAIIVRYADDSVVGFQHKRDAERYLRDVRERLARFGLSLHPDKTRLVEFGRFAVMNRRQRGAGKPETFDFLGFTHYCTTTRRGRFRLGRKPIAKRVNRTLARIDEVFRKRWHHDIWEVGEWLGRVYQGWLNYFAVPGSSRYISAIRRRLQTPVDADAAPAVPASPLRLEATGAHNPNLVATGFNPAPMSGLPSITRGRSRMVQRPCPDLRGGCAAMRIPTATAGGAGQPAFLPRSPKITCRWISTPCFRTTCVASSSPTLPILPPTALAATAHPQPLAQPTALRHPGSRCDIDSHPDCRPLLTLIVAPQPHHDRALVGVPANHSSTIEVPGGPGEPDLRQRESGWNDHQTLPSGRQFSALPSAVLVCSAVPSRLLALRVNPAILRGAGAPYPHWPITIIISPIAHTFAPISHGPPTSVGVLIR